MKRYVGMDLGSAGRHQVVAVDESGKQLDPPVCFTTDKQSIDAALARLVGDAPVCDVTLVVEPTGTVWQTIGRYLQSRGYRMFVVSPQKSHDLRRFYKRHAKTDCIDALALARMPLVHPDGLFRAPLEQPLWQSLRRGVKREAKLARQVGDVKRAIQAKAETALPGTTRVVGDPESELTRLVYLRYLDCGKVKRLGRARFRESLEKNAGRITDVIFAEIWGRMEESQALLSASPTDLGDLVPDMAGDYELLGCLSKQLQLVQRRNCAITKKLDPAGLVSSIYGIGDVLAPAILAGIGTGERFPSVKQFLAYTGLVPRVEESGQTRGKGMKMTKAGPTWLRRALYLAADVGRLWDPQLASVYHRCMVEKGHPHTKAVCVVAMKVAARVYAVVKQQRPYELRDTHGCKIDPMAARSRISQNYRVPEEVRARTRKYTGSPSMMKSAGRPKGHPIKEGCPASTVPSPLPQVNTVTNAVGGLDTT